MADFIAPTPERIAKAAHWDIPTDKQTIGGREVTKATRSGYRHVSVIKLMHQAGELPDTSKIAFDKFEKDYNVGELSVYATPNRDARTSTTDPHFCPVARRVNARLEYQSAKSSVGFRNSIVLTHCLMEYASKYSVGNMLAGAQAVSKPTAIKKGKEAIRNATHALAIHYGLLKHPPSP
jgi:hypothetical protein